MPTLNRLLPIFFFLVLFTVDAFGRQGVVRGFVTDASTEQSMQSASISLSVDGLLQYGSATDGDGFFSINRVPVGTYTLRISFVGYVPFEEEIRLSGGDVLERIVVLEPRPEEFEEVIVEAEYEGSVATVAAGLETVTPAAIQRVPVPGVSGDLSAYMQTVPGVVVQGDRGGLFHVRGGAADQNLALVDGLPVYMPFHIVSFYSAFAEEIVDRAAFYTGGFGAKYGTRASSIIDVSTRNGNKRDLSGAVAFSPFLSAIRLEGPVIRNRVSFMASARQSLVEELTPELFGQRMPFRFGDRFAKVHALLGKSHDLSVTFLDTDDRGEIAGTQKTFMGDAVSQSPDGSIVHWSNTVAGGLWTYRSNAVPLTARFGGGMSRMDSGIGGEESDRTSGIESTEAHIDLTWRFRDVDLNAGAMQRSSTLTYKLLGLFDGYLSSKEDLVERTTYAEADIRAGALHAVPGVHLYLLPDRSESWIDPRVRADYKLTSRLDVHAAWGVYHQVVTGLMDERDLGNLFTAWVPVDDAFAVPRSQHMILGINARITPWLGAAAEVYRKNYEHLAVPSLSAFPRFTTTLQEAKGTARGADVRVDFQSLPFWLDSVLEGFVSFAWSDVEYRTATDTYPPPQERPGQLNMLLAARKGELAVTLQWQYGSGLPFTPSSGFDQWYLLTPDVDVATQSGETRILYGEAYSRRQPRYSRVDVWIERRVEKGRYVGTIRAGAVNLFNRHNLFYYDLFTFQRVDHLPLIPSLGLKMELR